MKDIIVIDRTVSIIDELLKFNLFYIVVLIVDSEEQKKLFEKNVNIGKVITMTELEKLESVEYIDFADVRKYKGIALKVENSLSRFCSDYQKRKYHYYMGLSFWLGIFKYNDIKAVIINSLNHGLMYDGIPHDLAIMNNINCYTINPIGYDKSYIFNNLKGNALEIKNKINIINIKEILSARDGILNVRNYMFANEINQKGIRKQVYKMVYGLFGYLGVEFCSRIAHLNFKENMIGSTSFSCPFSYKVYSYLMAKKNEYSLKNKSVKFKADSNEKYIYYPLHFEPEGVTNVRVVLESQIVIVKMLAKSLPNKWKIYVKEHPAQYDVNHEGRDFYIPNMQCFKTKYFYDKIKEIPNVELIDGKCDGDEIAQKSQAIATIVGSVAFEAIIFRKPVLLFSELQPVRYVKDIFLVDSFEACKRAVKKIADGLEPDYTNAVNVLNKYILMNESDVICNIKAIISDMDSGDV